MSDQEEFEPQRIEDDEDTEGNRRRVRRTAPMAVEDDEDTEGNRRITP